MKESRIIKSIKYHVVHRLLNEGCWEVNELFAYAAAIIFPFIKYVEYNDLGAASVNKGSIGNLVKEITKCLSKIKDRKLTDLSFEGLSDFFEDKICSKIDIEKKKKLLSESISLIDSIDPNGLISWKGDCEMYKNILRVNENEANLYAKYGQEAYKDLPSLEGVKNEICQLYDDMVKSREDEEAVKDFEYIWQWFISLDEYNKIAKTLNDNKDVIGKRFDEFLKDEKCVWIFVAYIAERYKREWNGNNREENAIIQLGLETNNCKSIACKYFGEDSAKIFKHDNECGHHEWLESLRMEGGLPIKYIVDGHGLDFITNIYENPEQAIGSLKNDTSNRTRIYSYQNEFSIYKYVNALKDREQVYSPKDAEQDLFKKFQEILENGKSNARRNASKFSIEYAVWKWNYSDEFTIHRQVSLKSAKAYDEEQEAISIERIRDVWKIENPTYVFWLRIGKKDYEFYQKGDSYCSVTGRLNFPLSDIDLSDTTSLTVKIKYIPQGADGQKEKDESHWIDVSSDIVKSPKYILFSSKDGNKWYQGRYRNKGAILILDKSIKVEQIGYIEEKQLDGGIRWVEFDTLVKVNDKIESIGYTEIQPKSEAVHPIAKLSYVQNIKLRHNKNEENIWLLTQSGIKKENFERIADDGKVYSIGKIELFKVDKGIYEEINEGGEITGFTTLRLDGKVVKALVLPDNANITREIGEKNGRIIVHNIDNIVEFDQNKNTCQKRIVYSKKKLEKTTCHPICIKIDDDSKKVVIDVVYPWSRRVCMFGNTIVDTDVPQKIASKYKLMIFDDKGVRCIENRESSKKYNKSIQKEDNRYHVGAEDNLEFVFMATDGTEYTLDIERKETRNGVRYYLNGIPENPCGVIFQTLKNKSSELYYYEHLLVGCKERFDFRRKMGEIAPFLKCEEHNLYYDVLLYPEMITPTWFFAYCEDCVKNNRTINYKHLWEAANDCEVDWMLKFPRSEWLQAMAEEDCDCKKKWVVDLFRRHPQYYTNDLECFVGSYWNLQWNRRAPQGRSDEMHKFLFFVTKCQRDNDGIFYYGGNNNKHNVYWQIPNEMPKF